jgi:Flp pilus assembly protein TadD
VVDKLAVAALLMTLLRAQDPSKAAVFKKLGMTHVRDQNLGAAQKAFATACELDPKDEDNCYFLARTLYMLDRWEDAKAPFEKALRAASKPALARVHRAIALNFIALGNTAGAERHLKEAVRLYPGLGILAEDPHVDYGAFLFRQGRLQEALPLLKEAVQTAPGSARAQTEMGRLLLHLGRAQDAVDSLRKAVDLNPRASSPRLLLGRAYMQLGRTNEAQRELQLARELAGESASLTTR